MEGIENERGIDDEKVFVRRINGRAARDPDSGRRRRR
jgi:hypothetical protein